MSEPSIKGSGFESAAADILRLVEEGRLSREELEARLQAKDLPYLDEKVMPSSWYPLDTYDRLVQILLELEGGGDVEYLVQRGRAAAERLIQAGLYQQLDATLERWGDKFGRIMSTLGSTMFSDTVWSVEKMGSEDEYVVEVTVPGSFPDSARYSSQGFIEQLGSRAAKYDIEVTSARSGPTRVSFRTSRRR